jgi:hypothetical protein
VNLGIIVTLSRVIVKMMAGDLGGQLSPLNL